MRMMMQMMEQAGNQGGPHNIESHMNNQTLEINPAHPIIVNLNYLRK
jgi:HSP90 family molecular chaperone